MDPTESPGKPLKSYVRRSALFENVANVTAGDMSCSDVSDIELQDVPATLEATLKPRPYEASTLFNIDLDEIWGPSTQEDEVQQYKKRAQGEQQKFVDFVMQAYLNMDSQNVSYQPSKEQQRYLDQGPNLQNFVRGSLAFTNAAIRFQAEHEDMMELQSSLEDQYQFMRNTLINNATHQNLAGPR
ncbi:uncharacterized protein LOC119556942 [Drosophila subpulchrella]|uniref:uncharacterized protein LOC119556942 n=1 Tax=Drosophila subpulchrella TaxID=1486046 RepID=UPI0018A147A2|nr:uncharacterized protein LOC119556942 [Drosophila subpulchrella]